MKRKTLQELTIKNNFMFAAVMMEPENCKGLLERVLTIPIDHVEVDTEKSMIHHPEYKGVRLDVYAKDNDERRFNVEMQVSKSPITLRSRYYHSQIDMDLLKTGEDYELLPDSYVIFICDYDPFGEKKYCYTLETKCIESPELAVHDGLHTIILSNRGENESDVSSELVNFLKFTKEPLKESEIESGDEFIRKLQESIRRIKSDRLMEDKYMVLEMMLKEERREGREEGLKEGEEKGELNGKYKSIFYLLEALGHVPENVKTEILEIKDEKILLELLRLASKSNSIEEFESKMKEII